MTDPDPNEPQTITVPAAGETTTVRLTGATPDASPTSAPGGSNGSHAMGTPPLRPDPPEPSRPSPREAPEREEPRVVSPPPPASSVTPRTAPPATLTPPGPPPPRPQPAPTAGVATSRWMIIHPHVSFFGWLADKQGPADATPEERLQRYRQQSPWLFRTCVVLDLLVLFVVSSILVVALGAALFKAIFGVI